MVQPSGSPINPVALLSSALPESLPLPELPVASENNNDNPTELNQAAQDISTSVGTFQKAINGLKSGAMHAKKWIEEQLEWVDKHDDIIYKFVITLIAIEFVVMGGPTTLICFVAGYVFESLLSDHLEQALDRIKTVWFKSKTMKLILIGVAMLAIPSWRWHFASLIFGGYLANISKPENLQKDAEKDAEGKEVESQNPPPERTWTAKWLCNPFYWEWSSLFKKSDKSADAAEEAKKAEQAIAKEPPPEGELERA